MKIFYSLVLSVIAAVCVFGITACARKAENGKVIAIVIPAADHGWTAGVISWAEKAKEDIGKEDPSAKVIIATAKSAQDQVSAIETLMQQGINTMVLLPVESEALTPICKKVKSQGVKLVVVDRGLADPELADMEVVGDNAGFGEASAKAMAEVLGGKGLIVAMEGVPCQTNTDRVNGFKKVIADYPEIKVDYGRANWNDEEGAKLMENKLIAYNQIDAVWAGDDDVLRGVLNAYRKSGRTDVKAMSGGGGSQYVIGLIKNNDPVVKFTITYPPKMIYNAAMLALKDDFSKKRVVIPAEKITPENAEKFVFEGSKY